MSTKDPFAGKTNTLMEVNGLKATLNMPKAVERKRDKDGNEIAQGLPPYAPRAAFVVDEYPACPTSWMHGNSKASSYFVPILAEHGMWLDFTQNMHYRVGDDVYDVAVLPTIQGVNPLTGMKSDPLRLEQYKNKCPKHDKEFAQNRFCDDCKFSWHPQNYLSSNNGSPFWIDGFRTEDGTIRQWYFTEEEAKGVAAQIIGDERVFAIGVAFYLSKKPKPRPNITYTYRSYPYYYGSIMNCAAPVDGSAWNESFDVSISNSVTGSSTGGPIGFSGSKKDIYKKSTKAETRRTRGSGQRRLLGARKAQPRHNSPEMQEHIFALQSDVESNQLQLEIGAGAKIHQRINPDPQELDYWQEEPAGFIYINYCDVATAESILAAGKRQEVEDGFLAGLEIKE